MKKRRAFIKGILGISAGFVVFNKLSAGNLYSDVSMAPDIEAMTYCCLKCGPQCHIFKATANNDLTAKQTIAEEWSKQLGSPITVEEVFCYGCKAEEKPRNKMLLKCTVRKCVKEKQLKSCSLCSDLEKCEKDLWKNWPKVKLNALKIQKELKG